MPKLCCLLNPHVVCIGCLAPICLTCVGNESFTTNHCIKGCRGLWYPTYHEAVTNPEVRKKYMTLLSMKTELA